MNVRMSMKPALPSLRPISPASISDTPRGIKPPSKLGAPTRYTTDFEVNRSLFSHSPRQKKMLLPKAEKEPENTEQEAIPEQKPSDILLIEDLVLRIPDFTSKELDLDTADPYTISPILDRILCVTISWKPDDVKEYIQYPIISTLENRLFALIDIDDFLLRTIICKIILCLALDASSSLLLPVARIFYKLSNDSLNDQYFLEEEVDGILIQLILNSPIESKVFAAGALKNIASYKEIADRLAESKIFEIFNEILDKPEADDTLKVQMLSAIKNACKSKLFQFKLLKTNILSRAAGDPILFNDVLRTCAAIPDVPKEQRTKIMSFIPKKQFDDEKMLSLVTRSMLTLSKDLENTIECCNAILFLLPLTKEHPELQLALLQIGAISARDDVCTNIFESNGIILGILKGEERDIEIGMAALEIVKHYKNPSLKQLIEDYTAAFTF
ncbi:hypothetical protein TVAG_103100 [Trichomonas vaginalis G3]|uniref:Armadillo/beta-catenin-like repeat family protein n=1 Tax=Trichomonas vaginalis (strain ATCC PRA-98 / G3) TaxID=412133 RepID=A2EKM1_TRIV3|nr:armadillo repeat containing 2 protein family [Trichomonas vaginalis G3]EAY06760.1 hypothetical protein TVAG_103100 [Trichomonas vaginalis G3]KAI5485889.1 armadillo repeat containing 2 protein family [Trichomonas vaginalis G3]|eukprot:XP_001318983.1 hypothetical protein [Trichomonas vaginalis G3]